MTGKQAGYLHLLLFTVITAAAQPVPSVEEKIPFICTFGANSDNSWGDDDFVQVMFFVVPETYKRPLYIRVFDADCGGSHDENHNSFDTETRFSVYGGARCHSEPAAQSPETDGNYKSGVLLKSIVTGQEKKYDNAWTTLGPFNPAEGELQPGIGGRVLKVVIEGTKGDDGNLYKLFLSSEPNSNESVEGGNGFAYEYTFRLSDQPGSVSHLYPFVPEKVTAVKIRVFDYDDEGMIRIVSVARKGDVCQLSEDGPWIESRHRVTKPEINTSLDLQFIKKKEVRNNNIVVYITNQYGETMPFYTSPIGGIPKYAYKIGVEMEE